MLSRGPAGARSGGRRRNALQFAAIVCDIHTVTVVDGWPQVGERIRQARLASALSQASVAGHLGIDRSALARIEAGQRQVSALELFRLAEVLGVSIGHFVTQSPTAVVSRRQELADDSDLVSRARFRMDAALEDHARDAGWLIEHGFLRRSKVLLSSPPPRGDEGGVPQAMATARELRQELRLSPGPVPRLTDVCSWAGLHLLALADLEAGASLLLEPGLGVAVIGGADQPGRRRLTAAHELGHFVLQDEYTTDIGVAASRDAREQRIDAFACEFLLPAAEISQQWPPGEAGPNSARQSLIRIAGQYRVSWSVAVRSARRNGLLQAAAAEQLLRRTPHRGEFLEVLGHEPAEDLPVGDTSALWRQAALGAWRSGEITAARAVELLHGAVTEEDLPERDEADPA